METIGLLVFASLFVVQGLNHILNHNEMAEFTESVLGNLPLKKKLSFFGGAPTGIFLIAAGVGAAFNQTWALYSIAGFLAIVTALFHRDFLTEPGGFKGVALLGVILALLY